MTLIERVARALRGHMPLPTLDQAAWPIQLEAARAAIAAMREPTETMVDAGTDAIAGPSNDLGGPVLAEMATEAWAAMINAALKE